MSYLKVIHTGTAAETLEIRYPFPTWVSGETISADVFNSNLSRNSFDRKCAYCRNKWIEDSRGCCASCGGNEAV